MAAGPQLKQQIVGKVLCLNDIHTAAAPPPRQQRFQHRFSRHPNEKKRHNHFRLSCEQTNQLFMKNEYCILLLKWLLILFHKPEEKDLIWRAGCSSAGGGGPAGSLKKLFPFHYSP